MYSIEVINSVKALSETETDRTIKTHLLSVVNRMELLNHVESSKSHARAKWRENGNPTLSVRDLEVMF